MGDVAGPGHRDGEGHGGAMVARRWRGAGAVEARVAEEEEEARGRGSGIGVVEKARSERRIL